MKALATILALGLMGSLAGAGNLSSGGVIISPLLAGRLQVEAIMNSGEFEQQYQTYTYKSIEVVVQGFSQAEYQVELTNGQDCVALRFEVYEVPAPNSIPKYEARLGMPGATCKQ